LKEKTKKTKEVHNILSDEIDLNEFLKFNCENRKKKRKEN
jgi:hypothetical protein